MTIPYPTQPVAKSCKNENLNDVGDDGGLINLFFLSKIGVIDDFNDEVVFKTLLTFGDKNDALVVGTLPLEVDKNVGFGVGGLM